MGLPVIGPNVEGFRDSVIDGVSGVLFDQNEGIEGICRAVSAVTTNVVRYAELSEGAARNAERFRASESARKYLDIYAGLTH